MIDHINQSKIPKYLCPPDKKALRVYMDDRSGLNLYITRNGSRTWDFQFKSPTTKKSAHYKVGDADIVTVDEAKEAVIDLRRLVSKGIDPRDSRKQSDEMPTYTAFMENDYLPMADIHKKSAAKDRQMFRDRLKPEFGHFKLDQITRRLAYEFYLSLQRENLAVASCNHYVKLLRHSLNVALDWQLIDRNPIQRFKLQSPRNTRDRYLSDEELARFIKVLNSDHNRPVCRILLWLIGTGCRLSEALHARTKNLSLEQRTWVIPSDQAKGGKSRTVYLSDFCMNILKEREKDSEWLFPNPKTGKPFTTIRRVYYRLKRLSKLPDEIVIHSLRHSYCTYLAQAGASGPKIMQAMGHADFRTSQLYIHLNSEVYEEASNYVAARIDSALKKASGEN
jgi:integrase